MNISINSASCIKCGKCVQVCPIRVFTQLKQSVPVPDYPNRCIGCGHCVMVGPTDSVVHELFPPEIVQEKDYDKRPNPDQLMLLLKSRRSNRVFSKDPVPEELIEKIIEAANCAPTASNSLDVSYTVIADKEKIREISELTLSTFENLFKPYIQGNKAPVCKDLPPKVTNYISLIVEMRKYFDIGFDMISRNASALIFMHAPESSNFGNADCNLAYQNGSLMAETLGVGQVYGGFIMDATKHNPELFKKVLSCDGTLCAVMMLGMPKYKYKSYADKKAPSVKYFK